MKSNKPTAKAKRLEGAKRIERLFVILGYFSILIDVIVTTATFFFIRQIPYSYQFLVISDYLVTIEVILAAIMFAVLVILRHYDNIIRRLSDTAQRLRKAK